MEKQQTEILFTFDTEDFTNPRSADAVKELADLFTSEGVTAHFVTVGYMARSFVERRRYDVIEAMKPHLKLVHTLTHSVHPNLSELSETEDLEEAIRRIRSRETQAVGMVMGATGAERLWGACPPGTSESAAAYYTWAGLGLPFYVGGYYAEGTAGEDVWFCNLRQVPYSQTWEEWWEKKGTLDIGDFLDRLASRRRAIVYCHPNRVHGTEFWDILNFKGVNLNAWGRWKYAEEHPVEESQAYLGFIRTCLRKIKADPRFKVTTLAEIDARKRPRRIIRPADVPAIRRSLAAAFGPVREPGSWSLSDCFVAAVRFLCGETSFLPSFAYGFLRTPTGVSAPTRVRREDLVRAAQAMDVSRFLPSSVVVGARTLGPADFLFAALEALETGADEILVSPKEQRGGFGPFPSLEKMTLKGTWLFPDDFEDRFVSESIRNQIWTLRYE